MKKIKITYNPKGIRRDENIMPKISLPENDLSFENIIIKSDKDHYWRIEKKKGEELDHQPLPKLNNNEVGFSGD